MITLQKYARNTRIEYFPFDSSRKVTDKYYKPLIFEANETHKKLFKGKLRDWKSKNELIRIF